MRKVLVIAKYAENVSWISQVDSSWEVVVYSKDPNENDPRFIKLPNIGRESHTYLTWILNNYDDLPDICAFSQGNPFDHSPDFLQKISNIQPRSGYLPLSEFEAVFDAKGFPQLAASPLGINGQTFEQFYNELIGSPPPPLMYCRMNALFVVDAESIRARPKNFYSKCLTMLTGEGQKEFDRRVGMNLVEGHFLERMWQAIFSPIKNSKEENYLVYGMPPDRLSVVAALLERWPAEVERVGPMKASAVLLAASEILNSVPSASN